jgi:hypothetical protein
MVRVVGLLQDKIVRKTLAPIRRFGLGIFWQIVLLPSSLRAWISDRKARQFYGTVTEADLLGARKSDTVFVCGTGLSIASITSDEWERIGKHDVLSFRCFPKQSFVNVGFHVTGEIDDVDEYAKDINSNPLYDQALFLVQGGLRAHMGNRLIGGKKLRIGAPLFRFKRKARGVMAPLSKHFSDGVVHGFGSVCKAINVAYILGWKRIVLVGIDLYDHRHFYHPPDKLRDVEKAGIALDDPYTTSTGIVELVGMWNEHLLKEGRGIFVYNPKSLLAARVPVFDWTSLPGDD